jgi:hypothetical protein
MAYGVDKWEISLESLDKGGNLSIKTYELQATTDAEAATAATAFVTAYATMTECFIPTYKVSKVISDPLIVGVPASDLAMNSVQAVVSGSLAVSALKRATFVVNGPKAAVFVATSGPNRNVVNVAADPTASFIGEFKGGGSVYISDHELFALDPNPKGIRRTSFRRLAE